MTFIDVIVGACMQAKHLAMALRWGDPLQLVRALSLEASHFSSAGGPEGEREAAFDRLAEHVARDHGTSEGLAFVQACRGVRTFLRGRFEEAQELLELAYADVPHLRAGWHSNVYIYRMYTLVNLGRFTQLSERLPRLLEDAAQRSDMFVSVAL